MRQFEYRKEKLKALVHYVIWRAGDRPGFGATKLNKVLWFSDARSFMLTGRPITGAVYIRETFGPVPKAMMPIRHELEREGIIRVTTDAHFNRKTTRMKALVEPEAHIFSHDELQIVDWWIEHIDKDHTASSISEESHDYAWEIAKPGEEVPYTAFFATRIREPDGDRLEWAKRRAKELGLP